jgi:hypothetical protein
MENEDAEGGEDMPEEKTKITDETKCSTTELAMVLGVTARRVQQMAQDGTLQTISRGNFLLADNVQRYIIFISGHQLSAEEKKMEKARKSAEIKMKMAKADIAMLEANELKGNMHRSADVAALTQDMVTAIRAQLTALPGRLSVEVAGSDDPEECSIIIRDAVREIMENLTNYHYDPAKYEKLVRQRRDWAERTVSEEQEAEEDA